MKITISGSMVFYKEMQDLASSLEGLGYKVQLPNGEAADINFDSLSAVESIELKKRLMDDHLERIKWADTLLVANYDKEGKPDYIGTSTFMEIVQAYVLGKQIYILNKLPEQNNKLEIQAMMPTVLGGDITHI